MIKKFLPLIILILTLILFFYPVLKGQIPFPGDLLVGHYAPWNSYSYLGYAPGGVPHKAQGIDVVRQLYPWKSFVVENYKRGEWALWNPYNFSGNPQAANFQSGAFYPLNLVFFLPFNLGWTIFIMLQPLLAFLFMYLFLRQQKLSLLPSVLGSLTFAFSLYMAVWLEYGNIGHSLLWLPLLLLLVDKLDKKFCWKYLVFYSLALTSAILSGYIQQVIYGLVLIFGFFIYKQFKEKFRTTSGIKIALLLIATGVAFLLSAIQLIPTWEIFVNSARNIYSSAEINQLLLPWFYLITIIIPDFFGNPANRNYWLLGTYIERVSYIGLVPIVFFLYHLFSQKRSHSWFFIFAAVIVVFLAINFWPAKIFYGLHLPIIGTTVPTRILALLSLILSFLGAYGLEDFLQKDVKIKRLLAVPILFIIIWMVVLLLPKLGLLTLSLATLSIIKRNLFISSLIILVVSFLVIGGSKLSFKKNLIASGLILLTIFDLFFFFQRITPFSPRAFIYPKAEILQFLQQNGGIWRFWGYGTAYIDTNFATAEKIFSPEGTDPLFIRRYGELVSTSDKGSIKNPLPRADVALQKGFGESDLRQNVNRQRILDLLGVRFLLYKNERDDKADYVTFPEDKYRLFIQKGIWQIYENKEVVPRFFLTGDYIVEQNDGKILNLIHDQNFPLKERIILEKHPAVKVIKAKNNEQNLKLISYKSNEVVFETITKSPQLLFLSDNYYPGWKATIDGFPTEIYRTDYSFRSIVVSKGKHLVVFRYEPESFVMGKRISIAVFTILLLTSVLLYFLKRHEKTLVN